MDCISPRSCGFGSDPTAVDDFSEGEARKANRNYRQTIKTISQGDGGGAGHAQLNSTQNPLQLYSEAACAFDDAKRQ